MIEIVLWKIQVQGALGWADVKIRPSPGERFATLEFSSRTSAEDQAKLINQTDYSHGKVRTVPAHLLPEDYDIYPPTKKTTRTA
jgi:hypothetical protein